MEKIIIYTINTLIKEADKILIEYGLQMEKEVLSMVKSASALIWNNAEPELDENFVYWMAGIENSFVERIMELHKEQIKQYLAE